MNLKSLKYGMAVAVAVMGITGFAGQSQAQTPVIANLTVDSAIDVVDGNDIDFGTWFIVYRNADAFELTMSTAGVVTPNNLTGAPGDSVALVLTAGTGQGTMTVDLPTGANGVLLNMQRNAITDFLDGGLTLQNITYETTTQGANQTFAEATNEPVTVVTGGTPELIEIGAEIAITAQPADGAHTADFDVTFAY